METKAEIEIGAELLADKLLKLSEEPNGAELQALVIAAALLGTYSPPFDPPAVDPEDMIGLRQWVLGSGVFPLTTRSECLDALIIAIETNQEGEIKTAADFLRFVANSLTEDAF